MTATASSLQLPASFEALVEIDTGRPREPGPLASAAFEAHTADGVAAVLRVGPPEATGLGEWWRRLQWLQGRVPAPAPLAFDVRDRREFVLTAELVGSSAFEVEYRVDAVRTVQHIGAALAEVHATPVEGCPFVLDTATLAADASARLRATSSASSSASATIIDPVVAHVAPERLAAIIDDGCERYAIVDEPVLCHGSPDAASFRLDNGRPVGFDGWERCGVGDRYLDLAILAAGVSRSLTPHLVPVLFEAYGLDRPELGRLDWFQLVDTVR